MTALKAAQVERFVDRPDLKAGLFLVYGSDSGRVHETARRLVAHFAADDTTGVVTLDASDVDAGEIVAEALSPTLFGGRRIVRVRGAGKELVPALADLAEDPGQAVLVLEAGNLPPRDPLRVLVEAAAMARTLPCYADDTRSLDALIRNAFQEARIAIEPDAVQALRDALGNDREVTRREIEKLILYAGEDGTISLETVELLCADNAATAIDAVLDAAATGHSERLRISLARFGETNADVQRLLSLALGHFANLRRWRIELDSGKTIDAVIGGLRPKPHFSRTDVLKQQMRLWPEPSLAIACERLQQAIQESRRAPPLARELAERVLLALSTQAAQH